MNKKIVWNLFVISIFLLPYDSIKHIMPSIYRPISVYPLAILGTIALISYIKNGIIDKSVTLIFSGIMVNFLILMINLLFFDSTLKIDYIITYVMGFFSYVGFDYGFKLLKNNRNNNEEYIYDFLKILGKAYYIPIFVGTLELVQIVIPINFRGFFNAIFGGGQVNRICMTSAEASWTSLQILLFIIIYVILYKKYRNIMYIFFICVLSFVFIYNASTQGIITGVATIFAYLVVSSIINKKINKLIKNFSIGIIAIAIIYLGFKFILPYLPQAYYTNRLKKLFNVEELIREDGSAFIRMIYPYIGLLMFLKKPLLGYGGGNYSLYLGSFISSEFSWAYNRYGEVRAHILQQSGSVYSLYIRLLAEMGIIGTIFYLRPIFYICKKIKRIKNTSYFKGTLFLLIFILCIPIQFDSLTYVPFWMIIAFINNLKNEE